MAASTVAAHARAASPSEEEVEEWAAELEARLEAEAQAELARLCSASTSASAASPFESAQLWITADEERARRLNRQPTPAGVASVVERQEDFGHDRRLESRRSHQGEVRPSGNERGRERRRARGS